MVSDAEWAEKLHEYERYNSKIKLLQGGAFNKSYVTCKVSHKTRKILVTALEINEHHMVTKTLEYLDDTGKSSKTSMEVDEYFLEIPSFVDDFDVYLSDILPRYIKFLKIKQVGQIFSANGHRDNLGSQRVQNFFQALDYLEGIDLQEFNLDGVKRLDYMFSGCYNLKYIIFKPQTLDSVSNIGHAFMNCSNLISVNLNELKLPNVQSIESLFQGCYTLRYIELSFLCGGKKLTNAFRAFSEQGITGADLSAIQIDKDDNTVDLSCAFYSCTTLKEVKMSRNKGCNIPVNKVTDLFDDCEHLIKVDLSGLDMQKIQQISGMFNRCSQIKTVEIADQQFKGLLSLSGNFKHCKSLEQVKILNCYFPWLIQIVKNFDDSGIRYIDLSGSKLNSAALKYLQSDELIEKLNQGTGISLSSDSEIICVDEPSLLNNAIIRVWIRNGKYGQLHDLKLVKNGDTVSIVEVE